MATKQFSKVTVDYASRKKSPFDLGGRVTTSLQFGEVMIAHCRKLVANSSHKVNLKSLVRLDPMVAPTSQGSMTVKFWHSFVGLSDLFRHAASFQTGKPISGSNGLVNMTRLPFMDMRDLSLYCLVGAKITPWILDANDDFNTVRKRYRRISDQTEINEIYSKIQTFAGSAPISLNSTFVNTYFEGYQSAARGNACFAARMLGFTPAHEQASDPVYLPCANTWLGTDAMTLFLGAKVDIAHCDFVFEVAVAGDGDDVTRLGFAVNMSNYGSRIFDMLLLSGIGVDFTSTAEADLTRLFATYMAYYGSFGLSKYSNFETSNCNAFLKAWENGATSFNSIGFNADSGSISFGSSGYLDKLFCLFIKDLAMGYVTEAVDYIASHRQTDVVCDDELGWVQNIIVAPGNTANQSGAFAQQNDSAGNRAQPKITTNAVYINSVNHTQVDADLLKLLWKQTNRKTIAGQELEKLLRAGGYGAYVDQQQSHFLGYQDYDIDVSDINATSDSVNTVTGKNSTLGQYVGKGIGVIKDDKEIYYETDEVGYWITLCAIVPDSSYVQGNDQTVYDIHKDDQYQVEMDSMGYELHRRSVVKAGSDVVHPGTTSSSDYPFGYEPRMMRYKVGFNVVAGDFRRRSTRDQYLPFVLCRWLDVDDMYEVDRADVEEQGMEVVTLSNSQKLLDTPIAGDAWRYINLYPWLANFERIFAFDKKEDGPWLTSSTLSRYIYCGERYDYFQLYLRVMHNCSAEMLPVSDSYNTTDDNDGKGKTMIQS